MVELRPDLFLFLLQLVNRLFLLRNLRLLIGQLLLKLLLLLVDRVHLGSL